MVRTFFAASLALVLSVSAVEARHKSGQTVPEDRKQDQQKAADQTPDPMNDPMAVPKWFGGAVDDILTGTSRALNLPGNDKR